MAVTIKDIAKIANVSHTTVSRALNNSPLIHPKTKKRIQEIAKQLQYTPNVSAKSLVLHRTYNIGLFFSSLYEGTTSSFFHEVVTGANSVIQDHYNLVVKGMDDYSSFENITRNKFDGIIIMSQRNEDLALIPHALNQGIPVVMLARETDEYPVMNVVSNDRQGAYNMVCHLIQCGHRDIGILLGKEGFRSSEERKQGYIDALRDHDILLKDEWLIPGNYDVQSGYAGMHQLFQLHSLPSAVFCSNDDMAVGAMKAIHEKGMHVPADISVAGFDDSAFSNYLSPSLTTVKRPMARISQEGTTRLLQWMENPDTEAETVYVNTELIIRESVRSLPVESRTL